jgi:hypothetical protein
MVDATSIAAGISGLKAAFDITKGILELKTMTDVRSKVIELQQVILSAQNDAIGAQQHIMSLLQEKERLTGEIERFKSWDAEKLNYELTEYQPGVLAYKLKASVSEQPLHWLCPHCFQQSQKSILQTQQRDRRLDGLVCGRCKNELLVFPKH